MAHGRSGSLRPPRSSSAVVFFALSPFMLVEPLTALARHRGEPPDRRRSGGRRAGPSRPAAATSTCCGPTRWGAPSSRSALAGRVRAWRSSLRRGRRCCSRFRCAFLLFITNTAPASRYLNPVLPFLATVRGVDDSTDIARRPGPRGPAFWLVVGACAVSPLIDSIRTDAFFRQDDTRTLARRFIEAHIPAGATILIQPYSVPLMPSREAPGRGAGAESRQAPSAASTKFQLQLSLDPYPAPAYRLIYLGAAASMPTRSM